MSGCVASSNASLVKIVSCDTLYPHPHVSTNSSPLHTHDSSPSTGNNACIHRTRLVVESCVTKSRAINDSWDMNGRQARDIEA
ncbi:hypothetical protein E4T47_08795 [Aureobasidium subglaciale]|nr:hypothetical protein E4T47_08795 [Aureobasidium subglaciale]